MFCRNVMIYFDKPTQYDILGDSCRFSSRTVCCLPDILKASCTPQISSAFLGRTVYERTDARER